jgi:glycerophosphoryl diester phosphodiesterase
MDVPAKLSLPRVIGHRGAAAYAPENTLASLREARRRGAAWVEFDVKLSQEGHPILMHDSSLRRTTAVDRPVAATSWAQIAMLDAGSWFDRGFTGEPVPDFNAAIDCLLEEALGVNVEIKPCPVREVATAEAACAVLDRRWPDTAPLPLISSFADASLAAARDAAPRFPRALLLREVVEGWDRRAAALSAVGLNVAGKDLTATQARAIKSAGYLLGAYTINDGALAKRLVDMGVDTIITDRPDTIIEALATS